MPVRGRSSLKERVAKLTADNLELENQLAFGPRPKRPAAALDEDDDEDEDPSYSGRGNPGVFGPKWLGQRRRRVQSEEEDEERPDTPEPGYALGLGKSARSLASLLPPS